MTLPNFLIIGAQKSGTSWLAKNLNDHPEVFIANSEIYFFNKQENFKKGKDWYEKYFNQVSQERLVGEKTPGYLSNMDACLRIHNTLPNVKLIAILRNPIRRAVSAIKHHKRKQRISPLIHSNSLLLGILSGNQKCLIEELNYQFISRGNYYSQLKPYYHYFDPSQILVLSFEEDIVKNSAQTLKNICNFLEINPDFEFSKIDKKVNSHTISFGEMLLNYYFPYLKPVNRYTGKLLPNFNLDCLEESTISKLSNLFYEDNKKLSNLIGKTITSLNIN